MFKVTGLCVVFYVQCHVYALYVCVDNDAFVYLLVCASCTHTNNEASIFIMRFCTHTTRNMH